MKSGQATDLARESGDGMDRKEKRPFEGLRDAIRTRGYERRRRRHRYARRLQF
jgi:hypothetical protein